MEDIKQTIFNKVKLILQKYEGRLKATFDSDKRYDLYSTKEIIIAGKNRGMAFFASLVIQKDFVGFYYMPIYTDEADAKKFFKPELLKLLKGKSCIHLKKDDPEIYIQIQEVLDKGFELYKSKGWI